MKTTQTFSILIWANKSRASGNKVPIYARVTIDGKRAEISHKKSVDIENWDAQKGYVESSGDTAKTINNYIDQVKSQLFKIYTQMQTLDEFVTVDRLKRVFLGEKEERKTILSVFDQHNTQMELRINIERVTWQKFINVRNKLADFIKTCYRENDIFLEELNHQFVVKFEIYLRKDKGIEHNTTMKYIRNLKKVMNDAIRNEWLLQNPFANFKCSFKKVERDILTIEELTLIQEKEFKIPRIEQVKDLFVFSCYTGLAYINVMRLTSQNLSIGIDGNRWIFTERKKTGEKVRIPLLPQAMEIIEKYKDHPSVINRGGLLTHMSNQKLNSYLKEIADLCGLEKNLTFHLARHTFATTVTLANGVPIETVSKLLGHSSIKTTQIYAKVIEKKVSEDMELLRSKLTQKSGQIKVSKL